MFWGQLLLAGVLSSGGCASQLNPRERLAESIHRVNQAARWGRSGTVLGEVSASYHGRFMARRREWGEQIQLADAEVLEVSYVPWAEQATAMVRYHWYRPLHMTLLQTVVQQSWERAEGRYGLADERVVGGEESLFAEPKRDKAEGG